MREFWTAVAVVMAMLALWFGGWYGVVAVVQWDAGWMASAEPGARGMFLLFTAAPAFTFLGLMAIG